MTGPARGQPRGGSLARRVQRGRRRADLPTGSGRSVAPPAYDPELEPAAAVLALVPDDATLLDRHRLRPAPAAARVADPHQRDPAPERATFWRTVDSETAALIEGCSGRSTSSCARTTASPRTTCCGRRTSREAGVAGMGAEVPRRPRHVGVRRAVDDGVGPLGGRAGSRGATGGRRRGRRPPPTRAGRPRWSSTALVGTPADRDVRRTRLHPVRRRLRPGRARPAGHRARRGPRPTSTSSGRSRWPSAATW